MRPLLLTSLMAVLLLSSFDAPRKNRLKLPDEFAKIPGGTFSLYNEADLIHFKGPDSLVRTTLKTFYMSKYEVSNLQYRRFYDEASAGLSEDEKGKLLPDTAAWTAVFPSTEPMKQKYYSHAAYDQYPVVNISYEGALKYCAWLQEKIQKENPAFEVEVRLPSKLEWIWAAMGGRTQAMFPWGNYYLRNRKGEFMCNFRRVGDGAIYRNKQTGLPEVSLTNFAPQSIYTANVKSFTPNDFGLYNMCGNAAEMVSEKGTGMGGSWNDYGGDVHIRAEAAYEKPSPTMGFRPMVVVREKG